MKFVRFLPPGSWALGVVRDYRMRRYPLVLIFLEISYLPLSAAVNSRLRSLFTEFRRWRLSRFWFEVSDRGVIIGTPWAGFHFQPAWEFCGVTRGQHRGGQLFIGNRHWDFQYERRPREA